MIKQHKARWQTLLVAVALSISVSTPCLAGSVFFRQMEAVDFCRQQAATNSSSPEKQFCDGVFANEEDYTGAKGSAEIHHAADEGYVYAALYLGEDYYYSDIPANQEKAVYWLEKAAELDSPQAQLLLSHVMSTGTINTRPDNEKALYWLHKAADAGFGNAQAALGYDYAHGILVPRDLNQAVKWYDRASKADRDTETLVAMDFIVGDDDFPKDVKHGVELLTDAAQANYAPAQVYLSEVYRTGMGVAPDLVTADMWFLVAMKTGQDVPTQTSPAEAAMTQAQIAEAHALAETKYAQLVGSKQK
ncbi:tetratricopeptide repeat protein [Asticcacaulis benevestitus]|uniref:Sel1 repeat family protein n=1 Tax=Asticcacaulis benevestitus DSM 16100 = ATCC BAA-896 TaxID=1121022 RepID=V4QS12_9CAUL|nr:tetratricopeptide repeat protein [Asticcacaulis benevestitus]ESQ81988.1 hypothetical protein ABENE_21315 [Asticcacaulis benevestitus DSM 16100 = ATCC BAA-896]